MKTEKAYVISFGDSEKYSVPFDGSLEEFEHSKELKHIIDTIYDYVKEKYPADEVKKVMEPRIEKIDQRDEVYPVLNADNLGKLKHEVDRQLENA